MTIPSKRHARPAVIPDLQESISTLQVQQVLQNIRNGELTVRQVPAPMVRDGEVLIVNRASVVSAGTEKMVIKL